MRLEILSIGATSYTTNGIIDINIPTNRKSTTNIYHGINKLIVE